MCTFKVSKKPNVLNLQFKFLSPPLAAPRGGVINFGASRKFSLPPRFISVHALELFSDDPPDAIHNGIVKSNE